MAANRDKPSRWKADIDQSIALYNDRFMQIAPGVFSSTYFEKTQEVEKAFALTQNLANLHPLTLIDHPGLLPILRMATCPPLSRDQLIRLSQVNPKLIRSMEIHKRIPARMTTSDAWDEMEKITGFICRMADRNLLVWLDPWSTLNSTELDCAVKCAIKTITNRWCEADADDTTRQTLEKYQLSSIISWLEAKGYSHSTAPLHFPLMPELGPIIIPSPGEFRHHVDIPINVKDKTQKTKISIDVVIKPKKSMPGDPSLFINVKSFADFANVKRRLKDESDKIANLREIFGQDACFILFLCGYFNDDHLSYLTSQGIFWVWEHRIDDLIKFGV